MTFANPYLCVSFLQPHPSCNLSHNQDQKECNVLVDVAAACFRLAKQSLDDDANITPTPQLTRLYAKDAATLASAPNDRST